jgi:hypothetical protein
MQPGSLGQGHPLQGGIVTAQVRAPASLRTPFIARPKTTARLWQPVSATISGGLVGGLLGAARVLELIDRVGQRVGISGECRSASDSACGGGGGLRMGHDHVARVAARELRA